MPSPDTSVIADTASATWNMRPHVVAAPDFGSRGIRMMSALMEQDLSRVAFPCRYLSKTDAAGTALWIGIPDGPTDILGLGIDYEPARDVRNPNIVRFFLDARERAWLESTGDRWAGELLRLWTVKESLFKANPGNNDSAFIDYRVSDAGAASGAASGPVPAGAELSYLSVPWNDGYVSIALCRRRERDVAD